MLQATKHMLHFVYPIHCLRVQHSIRQSGIVHSGVAVDERDDGTHAQCFGA